MCDDYEAFVAQRKRALLERVAEVMGKPLIAVPDEGVEPLDEPEDEED